jgi:hypothetical protein
MGVGLNIDGSIATIWDKITTFAPSKNNFG